MSSFCVYAFSPAHRAQTENTHQAVNSFEITLDSMPPLQNQLHLSVTGYTMLTLVYLRNQTGQLFIIGLLLALCPVFPLIVGSPADANCLAELSHRPALFLVQLLNHLIFRQIPCTAEICLA